MTITYPLDFLSDFPGWSTEFELVYRQEQSRTASGQTIGKDLGSPLWRGVWSSCELTANEIDTWRARLEALEGVLKTFRACPSSRFRPILHPGSSALPTGALASIGADRKSITVAGLVGIILSPGDLIQIGEGDLHRVLETATGNPTGAFEVRPHIWPETEEDALVSIRRPSCLMSIVPGSISSAVDRRTGRGTISFQGFEAR
ncbi:hypothetical protein [Shinella sp. M31]|uniref:hypothetical protein n=1 Tax=Shinella sp. M31 TaxID=3368615 RepID=UPI003BA17571